MNQAIRALWQDSIDSARDLLPIALVIGIFQIFVIQQPIAELLDILVGAVFVVLGLAFFVYGLRHALFPIGEVLARSLASRGSVLWLVSFSFALGFGTTVAEPALIAVVNEAARVAAIAGAIDGSASAIEDYAFALRMTVAIAVGVAIVLGVMRIVVGWSLAGTILCGYVLVIALTAIAPAEIVGIAFDSGGVTTSTVTVPLVTALGVGLASSLKERNALLDGFGLIAFASLTPILFVLIFGIITA